MNKVFIKPGANIDSYNKLKPNLFRYSPINKRNVWWQRINRRKASTNLHTETVNFASTQHESQTFYLFFCDCNNNNNNSNIIENTSVSHIVVTQKVCKHICIYYIIKLKKYLKKNCKHDGLKAHGCVLRFNDTIATHEDDNRKIHSPNEYLQKKRGQFVTCSPK